MKYLSRLPRRSERDLGERVSNLYRRSGVMRRGIALMVMAALLVGGCSGMSNTNQRVLSGGAVGAGTGLLIGGPVGVVVGAGVGAAGGYAYDQHEKSDGKP
jgi:hypothetical protein